MDIISSRYPLQSPFNPVQAKIDNPAPLNNPELALISKDSFEPKFGWRPRRSSHRKTTFAFPNRNIKIDSPNALAMYRRAQEKFAELDYLKRDLRLQGYDLNSYTPEMLNVQRAGAQLTALFCDIAAQEIAGKYEIKAARLRELQAEQKDERYAEKRSLQALQSHIRKADDPYRSERSQRKHAGLVVRRRKSMQGHVRKQEKIAIK